LRRKTPSGLKNFSTNSWTSCVVAASSNSRNFSIKFCRHTEIDRVANQALMFIVEIIAKKTNQHQRKTKI
jgi:hypothetical protein